MYKGYIYKTTCLLNNKIYIGQHRKEFDSTYLGSGTLMLRAISKYHKDNFRVELLEKVEEKDSEVFQSKLNELEKKYIKQFNSQDLSVGYNYLDGGQSFQAYQNMVKSQTTDEFRKSMSEKLKKIKSESSCRKHHSEKMKEIWKDESFKQEQLKRINQSKLENNSSEKYKNSMKKHLESKEYHQKLSKAQEKIHSSQSYKEKHKARMIGRKRYNNGKIEVLAYECPAGFTLGCLPKGCWWNNGKEEILSKKQPLGFVKGRLRKV